MRALVTGATGFIGSHLVEELHKMGHEVNCLVRTSSKMEWLSGLSVQYVYGDYSDIPSLQKAVSGIDYIFHTAGVTKAKTKNGYFLGNHIATKNLLRAVMDAGVHIKRFTHISSQAAVGPSLNGVPIDEQTPYHPITTYGRSKMEGEKECLNVINRLPVTIVRPPAVYGPREKDIYEFFKTANKGLQPIIGFGKAHISLIHVRDLVNGIILAALSKDAEGQTYFISSERYYTWEEIGGITASVLGKKVLRLHVPKSIVFVIAFFAEMASLLSKKPALLNIEKARDIVQSEWTCSIEKAKNELGFCQSVSLDDGIRETIKWYRENNWLR